MTMHNVTTCPSTGYAVTLHGLNCDTTVLRTTMEMHLYVSIYLFD
jgi:hypothetical protein